MKHYLKIILFIVSLFLLSPRCIFAAETETITEGQYYKCSKYIDRDFVISASMTQAYYMIRGEFKNPTHFTGWGSLDASIYGVDSEGNETKLVTLTLNSTTPSAIKSYTLSSSIASQYDRFTFKAVRNYYRGGSVSGSYDDGSTIYYDTNFTVSCTSEVPQYTLSYKANGGMNAPSPVSATAGSTMVISSTEPTRDNYDFLGWSTSASSTIAEYVGGDTLEITENTTLYAVWRPQSPYFSGFQAPSDLTIVNRIKKDRPKAAF